MVFNEKKFEEFLRSTAKDCSDYKSQYQNEKRLPNAILMNLGGWKWHCPNCFSIYYQNGYCRKCGLKLAIEPKRK